MNDEWVHTFVLLVNAKLSSVSVCTFYLFCFYFQFIMHGSTCTSSLHAFFQLLRNILHESCKRKCADPPPSPLLLFSPRELANQHGCVRHGVVRIIVDPLILHQRLIVTCRGEYNIKARAEKVQCSDRITLPSDITNILHEKKIKRTKSRKISSTPTR